MREKISKAAHVHVRPYVLLLSNELFIGALYLENPSGTKAWSNDSFSHLSNIWQAVCTNEGEETLSTEPLWVACSAGVSAASAVASPKMKRTEEKVY